MDDKDRLDEAKGAEDALRPTLPGGERVREGESGEDAGENDAAGTVDNPIQPGATQPGETMEQAQLRGGPIDVSPARPKRG
ncbi:hypothetical protein HB662_08440 [Roseomonas frigidaquae]|uniref:Uncharacterized protein n=1 Tax=Falsiroseomonas frigidaquae TaxID=487318 RepID=A0ABX1EXL2_9PROT|nr:hypothetical protein [Falsiroseomonas frigidaquae]NKE44803.1 hypothetical protein [Falsiroseomonas frigidaquae]